MAYLYLTILRRDQKFAIKKNPAQPSSIDTSLTTVLTPGRAFRYLYINIYLLEVFETDSSSTNRHNTL